MLGGGKNKNYRLMGLGVEMVAAVAGLTLVGYWVDRQFGTAPWGLLIGALLGLVGGFNNLIRAALKEGRSMRREGRGREGEAPGPGAASEDDRR